MIECITDSLVVSLSVIQWSTDFAAVDALSQLPKVDSIWEDFATRNLIVEMASHDHWYFHKKEAVSMSAGNLVVSNDLRVFTMTLDSCVLPR